MNKNMNKTHKQKTKATHRHKQKQKSILHNKSLKHRQTQKTNAPQ